MTTHNDAPVTGRDSPDTARETEVAEITDVADSTALAQSHISNATKDRQTRFLEMYAKHWQIQRAADATPMNRKTHYDWLSGNVNGYVERWKACQSQARDNAEQTLVIDRLLKPQGNRGSDILAMFYLKAMWPDKYREISVIEDSVARDLIREVKAAARRRTRTAEDKPDAVQQAEELIRQRGT